MGTKVQLNIQTKKALWDRIKHKTPYRVAFDNVKLMGDCAKAILDGPPLTKTRA